MLSGCLCLYSVMIDITNGVCTLYNPSVCCLLLIINPINGVCTLHSASLSTSQCVYGLLGHRSKRSIRCLTFVSLTNGIFCMFDNSSH